MFIEFTKINPQKILYLLKTLKNINMLEFLNGLQPLEKGFWYVALISSVIFAIQSIMTFVGGHDADGINADFSGRS